MPSPVSFAMLFNTLGFIFVFLPVTLAGFFLLGRVHQTLARVWLASASLAFYGWWNPTYVVLLAGSIGVNYVMAASITRARAAGRQARARALLTLAVAANLVLLGWFKYAAFFVANLNAVAGAHWVIPRVVLPLGISFFTFTQIAYLVDLSRDEPVRYPFVDYVLFVTYFPHLIAGPILHHREMMPQFRNEGTFRFRADRASVGLTVFAIGLFKKVILADGVSRFLSRSACGRLDSNALDVSLSGRTRIALAGDDAARGLDAARRSGARGARRRADVRRSGRKHHAAPAQSFDAANSGALAPD